MNNKNNTNPNKRNTARKSKGKHLKEEEKKKMSKKEQELLFQKIFSSTTKIITISIISVVSLCIIALLIYLLKPEKINTIIDNQQAVSEYNNYLHDLTTEEKIATNSNSPTSKFIEKKYLKKSYNIVNGFFEKEYDIIYFSFENNDEKVKKLSTNSILSYEEYIDFCKKNNIKQKFNDTSKKYSIFANFAIGYENVDVFVCDRGINQETELMYLSQEYSKPRVNMTSGFVIIYPSSQKDTKNTEIAEVISESDFYNISGENIKITNNPINKDVLFIKNKTITNDEKVNVILNKMLDNICHQNTIHYNYECELPEYEAVDAKLDLNNCVQIVEKNDGKSKSKKYKIYGDYETVEFDEKGYIGNSWTYKDEIIKKFIKSESLSNPSLFDFKLAEDDEYYIIKTFVAKQNYTLEGKTSREEEFFYIDKNTSELKKMYCHNYLSKYTVNFEYMDETLSVPEELF
jgi:hypothetical protein